MSFNPADTLLVAGDLVLGRKGPLSARSLQRISHGNRSMFIAWKSAAIVIEPERAIIAEAVDGNPQLSELQDFSGGRFAVISIGRTMDPRAKNKMLSFVDMSIIETTRLQRLIYKTTGGAGYVGEAMACSGKVWPRPSLFMLPADIASHYGLHYHRDEHNAG